MKIKKRSTPADFQTVGQNLTFQAAPPVLETESATSHPPEAAFQTAGPLDPVASSVSAKAAASSSRAIAPRSAGGTEVDGEDATSGASVYLVAFVVSVLWAGAPLAFAWGYRHGVAPFNFDPFAMAVFALMAIGPASLIWLVAYMVRQGQKLSAETRRAKLLADNMVSPAVAAGVRTADIVQGVRDEIARASAAAHDARETLLALRQSLAAESERLIEAAAQSARTATNIVGSLGQERGQMATLAQALDAQATAVADNIAQQARMVAEASDLAETQLREAEAALAARAADLAAAAGEASDAARSAGQDLTRHVARLETAGSSVAEQIAAVEAGLGEHRSGLITAAESLRADHEAFAAQSKAQTSQLAEFISQARLSTMEMGDRTTKGGEALGQLIATAAEQIRELAETAKAERDEFGQSTLQSLEAVASAAAQQRTLLEAQARSAIWALSKAAEETRTAAEQNASAAREQVDRLSEAAFTAGQQANQVFEARMLEARQMIDQSTQMVDQAGANTARRMDAGVVAAKEAMAELAAMMNDIEARAQALPAAMRGQADLVRQAVGASMDDLLDQARRTADETQAIDEAFQERVQRNYEVLSEAVRMMGAMAAAPPERPAPPRERPEPRARAKAVEAPTAPPPPPSPEPEIQLRPLRSDEPVVEDDDDFLELDTPVPAVAVERQRLKLTPTASDAEFSSIFEQASGRAEEPAPEGGEGWTWKDLLSSIDEADGKGRDSELEDGLSDEIQAMGIDTAILLTRSRVNEIAAVIQGNDAEGARGMVRKLAPAATRRLARRLVTDDILRRRAGEFLTQYQDVLLDAAQRDPAGFLVTSLLGSSAGRTFLLLDAAAGDVV